VLFLVALRVAYGRVGLQRDGHVVRALVLHRDGEVETGPRAAAQHREFRRRGQLGGKRRRERDGDRQRRLRRVALGVEREAVITRLLGLRDRQLEREGRLAVVIDERRGDRLA